MTEQNSPILWKRRFPRRKKNSNKYDYGHAVIFGVEKMTGATRLAAEACARIGAGLTTVVAPKGTGIIYRRTLAPHVIVEDEEKNINVHLKDKRRNAVLIGPGAGKDYKKLITKIKKILAADKAVVLDADALNALSGSSLTGLKGNVVMTPHEGEFKRMFPRLKGSKVEKARAAAEQTGCVIVLKGPDTVIASPQGKIVINTNAPPWLATAGTGDVLAGMITGLLAQGMEPFDAACAAVWVHGEAAKVHGPGLVAGDISSLFPRIFSHHLI